jgi:hypothetical protein
METEIDIQKSIDLEGRRQASIQYTVKLLCVKISIIETEIDISKSIDLEERSQASIQVTFSSGNAKEDEQAFDNGGSLKT